jgi:hypothetical protein
MSTPSSPPSGPPIPFSALPLDKSNPDLYFNAWGLYGEQDERGFLNRQSDETVRAAAGEIRCGKRLVIGHHPYARWCACNAWGMPLMCSLLRFSPSMYEMECHTWLSCYA